MALWTIYEAALKNNANKQRVTAVEMDTDDMFAPL